MKRLIPILLFLSITSFGTAVSQDSLSTPSHWWVGLSYGSANGKNFSGGMGALILSLVRNNQIYTARILAAARPSMAVPTASDFNSYSGNLNGVLEASVLYGFVLKKKYLLFSISGGIGYLWGNIYSESTPTFKSFSFPFDVQIGFSPTPVIGIGLYFFANLNSRASFDGAMVCLHLGKLW